MVANISISCHFYRPQHDDDDDFFWPVKKVKQSVAHDQMGTSRESRVEPSAGQGAAKNTGPGGRAPWWELQLSRTQYLCGTASQVGLPSNRPWDRFGGRVVHLGGDPTKHWVGCGKQDGDASRTLQTRDKPGTRLSVTPPGREAGGFLTCQGRRAALRGIPAQRLLTPLLLGPERALGLRVPGACSKPLAEQEPWLLKVCYLSASPSAMQA